MFNKKCKCSHHDDARTNDETLRDEFAESAAAFGFSPEELDPLARPQDDALPDDDSQDGDPLELALRERDEAREKVLRVLADLENYRSRVNRERDEMRKYAEIDLMRDLLPVWDNLTRAIESAEKSSDATALLDGVRMVEAQLVSVLAKHQCLRMNAVGEAFDPHKHASISQIPTNDHAPNTIVHETQAGFMLHDRVVRPSQVVIAAAANQS
ncbi:MAG: nucleotide exchange factor GrpE [Thermoguttaceae bacterium]